MNTGLIIVCVAMSISNLISAIANIKAKDYSKANLNIATALVFGVGFIVKLVL